MSQRRRGWALDPASPVRWSPQAHRNGAILCTFRDRGNTFTHDQQGKEVMRRILLTVAAMLIPAAGLTLGISGTAGAATGKITCATFTGNASSTLVISGCTGGNTGGSSQPLSAVSLATGGTVTWVSGSTTTSGAPTLTTVAATHCPGYVKGATSNPSADSFTGSVTGDTGDGMLIPGTEAGEVCIGTDGSITALKPLKISWTASTIACTTITGNVANTLVVSGCTGGNTGGSSTAFNATALGTGGTIPWSSGGSTTIDAPTLTATSSKHCPGYVKGAASNPSADKFSAIVTADTGDGLKLPGSAKGAVCIGTDGSITALKPLAAK
jgi:hypothetical protein